ncbi:MAG: hypothetical protein JW709_06785 [Sedimentisphaerales bacterium]|nr:hypothetical protein [Sedimentisphaerales bacterium]
MDQNEQQAMVSEANGAGKKRKRSRRMLTILVALSPFILIAAVDIIIPGIARVKDLARLANCKSQLGGIGAYLVLYQCDYDETMPPTLQTLIAAEGLEPRLLICPGSDADAAVVGSREELEGKEPLWPLDEENDQWVYYPSGISYAYRGGDLTESDPGSVIVAYDLPDNHYNGWRNVLFFDGDVKKMSEEEFQAALEKDNQWRRDHGRQEIPAEKPDWQ